MKKVTTFIRNTTISAILIGSLYGLNILYNDPYIAENVFAKGITRFLSGFFSLISNLIPISLAEILIYSFILVMTILVIRFIVLLFKRKIFNAFTLAHNTVNFIFVILLISSITLTVMYNREESFKHFNLEYVVIDDELAVEAANYYADLLVELNNEIDRDENGNVKYPYTIQELGDIINKEYDKLTSDYFAKYNVKVKSFFTSEVLSYLGILGIYFPFTSEANVNFNTFPYELPTTIAHEMAHAKGVLRENEANFTAYYLCLTSDNEYLKYSGAMEAFMVIYRQLNKEEREEISKKIPDVVKQEYNNANEHYQKYRGIINEISSKVNDAYLKSSGVSDGIKSYSRTANELASLYLHLKDN